MGCTMRKLVSLHMHIAKAKISLHIDTVWSGPLLSANRIIRHYRICINGEQMPGPSCSKQSMSLFNNSLKFTSSANMLKFFDEKMWVAFAVQKLLTFFQHIISEYCILNPLKQFTKWPLTTMLWTTGPWMRLCARVGWVWICAFRKCSKEYFCLAWPK